MYISYWNPLRELEAFQRNVDRMLQTSSRRRERGYPPIDLVDAGDHFLLRALLPGVSPEDVDISVSGDQVSFHGSKKVKPAEGAKPIRRERAYGEFQRTVPLPEPVAPEKVQAEHKDGIVKLVLPKARLAEPVQVAL